MVCHLLPFARVGQYTSRKSGIYPYSCQRWRSWSRSRAPPWLSWSHPRLSSSASGPVPRGKPAWLTQHWLRGVQPLSQPREKNLGETIICTSATWLILIMSNKRSALFGAVWWPNIGQSYWPIGGSSSIYPLFSSYILTQTYEHAHTVTHTHICKRRQSRSMIFDSLNDDMQC